MKISIAMASYNGEKYIKEQLESFSSQTLLPDELIITDDCSTDRTEKIIKVFAENAPFKVIFHRNEKNLGYCGNFNEALVRTTGDLVFLSDQDDVWFPEKIETMVGLAEKNPDMLVLMNDTELTDGDLNSVGLTKLGQIKSAGLSQKSFVMGCCCAVRRELLDLCMPIPEGFKAHDNWLVEFADGLSAKMVDGTVLQFYRRHESNESQFIANRTVKVGRIHVLFFQLRRLFSPDRSEIEKVKISQMKLFISGLHRARNRGGYAPERVTNLLHQKELDLALAKERFEMRSLNIFARVFSIVIFMFEGKYKLSGGFKGVVKDLVG